MIGWNNKSTILFAIIVLIFVLMIPTGQNYLAHADTPTTLSVNVSTFQGSTSTDYNYMVIEATVTAGGTPVSGASIVFSDSFSSTFNGQTANTNSSGIALTTVQFNNGNRYSGTDTITASATATGYNSASGSANVTVARYSNTQLFVTPSLANNAMTGGGTDVISGNVRAGDNNAQGATVTITDTIGSTFSSTTVLTDNNGNFATNFTVASIGFVVTDLITVGVSSTVTSPSQSTIILQVNPYSSTDLTVTMNTFYPSTLSTDYNYMVIEATVTAGGTPVSGASIVFSDSFSSTFNGQTANTNSSGIALTTVQFNNGNRYSGTDTITASATKSGYSGGVGSNVVSVLRYSNTQLFVMPSLANNAMTGGGTDVISGNVRAGDNNAQGATVTITDTIGSTFSSTTVLTDNNGNFATNFTVASIGFVVTDLITVGVSSTVTSPSQSTIILQVNPYSSTDLTVTMNTFYPSTLSTDYNYMVIEATVTAGGTPVSGASIVFSDSFSSTFNGQTANTNSSGIALTTVQFNNGNRYSGTDTITASATKSGYSGGVGSNVVSVLRYSNTQLFVMPSLANNAMTGGGTDVISGNVRAGDNNAQGATVTITDTIGSTFNVTSLLSDKNGNFAASFNLPIVSTSVVDIITVSVSEVGYSSSTSGLYLSVNPINSNQPSPTPIPTPTIFSPSPTPPIITPSPSQAAPSSSSPIVSPRTSTPSTESPTTSPSNSPSNRISFPLLFLIPAIFIILIVGLGVVFALRSRRLNKIRAANYSATSTTPTTASQFQQNTQQPVQQDPVKTCNRCGKLIASSDVFCVYCGKDTNS